MRIVHYLHRVRLDDAGVVRTALDLCAALAARGHAVTLITSDATDVPVGWTCGEAESPTAEEIPPLNGPLKLLSRWSRKYLEATLAKADLVHVHEFRQPAAAHVAMIARGLGKPCVVSDRGVLDRSTQGTLGKRVLMGLVGNKMFRDAGTYHRTDLGGPGHIFRCLPHAVAPLSLDLGAFRVLPHRGTCRALLPGGSHTPAICFLDSLHPNHGIDRLILATHKLAQAGVLSRVFVAGTNQAAYEGRLRGLAARLGLSGRVHFVGHLRGDAKVRMLRGCDMLVLPTSQECSALILLESLACGTPVIATRAVDRWSDLEASGGAIVLDSAGPSGVGNAIGRLIRDNDRRIAMGHAGRRWVLENLDPGRVMNQLDTLYTGLVQRAAPTAATPDTHLASISA
jgi:glycosyltransferase involved in cell wall biosynthesis